VSDYLARNLHARLLPLVTSHWRSWRSAAGASGVGARPPLARNATTGATATSATAAPTNSSSSSSSSSSAYAQPALAAPDLHRRLSEACLDVNRRLTARLTRGGDDDGSTAVFALMAGDQLLVGNVGNSRAILCQRPMTAALAVRDAAAGGQRPHQQGSSSSSGSIGAAPAPLAPLALSTDHTPARPDEAARIAAAGGTVARSARGGKLRLDGDLEVSRAFGDPAFQTRGLTAAPEFKFHSLRRARDAFVILASDGVYEVMSPEEVCLHAWAAWAGDEGAAPRSPQPAPAIALGPVGGGEAAPPEGAEVGGRGAGGGGGGGSAEGAGAGVGGGGLGAGAAAAGDEDAQLQHEAHKQQRRPPAQPAGLAGSCGAFGSGRSTMAAPPNRLSSSSSLSSAEAAARRLDVSCRPDHIPAPYTLAEAVAIRITEEAYNRGSTDNAAVVCLDVGASASLAAAAAAERLGARGGGGGGAREEEVLTLIGRRDEGDEESGSAALATAAVVQGESLGANDGTCATELEASPGDGATHPSDTASTGDAAHQARSSTARPARRPPTTTRQLLQQALTAASAAAGARLPGTCMLLRRDTPAAATAAAAAVLVQDGQPLVPLVAAAAIGVGDGAETVGTTTTGVAPFNTQSGPGSQPAASGGQQQAAGGDSTQLAIVQGTSVVCHESEHQYVLTAHLVDAPLQPAHIHLWPLAKLPLEPTAAAAG